MSLHTIVVISLQWEERDQALALKRTPRLLSLTPTSHSARCVQKGKIEPSANYHLYRRRKGVSIWYHEPRQCSITYYVSCCSGITFGTYFQTRMLTTTCDNLDRSGSSPLIQTTSRATTELGTAPRVLSSIATSRVQVRSFMNAVTTSSEPT